MKTQSTLFSLATAAILSGCASLGTNINGSFECKAPGGSCAPTSVIDAAAIETLLQERSQSSGGYRAISSGATRTGEQILKIVFPGYIDVRGHMHEARVVHVVAKKPDWAAGLLGRDSSSSAKSIARRIANQAKSHAGAANETADRRSNTGDTNASDGAIKIPAPEIQSFFLPNRTVHPLTVREAIAGMKAPAIEGFDMLPPWHDRTPPLSKDPNYPTLEAIEAARNRSAKENAR